MEVLKPGPPVLISYTPDLTLVWILGSWKPGPPVLISYTPDLTLVWILEIWKPGPPVLISYTPDLTLVWILEVWKPGPPVLMPRAKFLLGILLSVSFYQCLFSGIFCDCLHYESYFIGFFFIASEKPRPTVSLYSLPEPRFENE